MYRAIFGRVKKIVPKISDTELIALRSGSTSLDREIFQGRVNLPNKKPEITAHRKLHLTLLILYFKNMEKL